MCGFEGPATPLDLPTTSHGDGPDIAAQGGGPTPDVTAPGDGTVHAPGAAHTLLPAEKPSPNEPFYCHVAAFCTQHKTGNAVEQITKFLGVLSPSFCLASCLANGDVADKLYNGICELLDRNLDVKDPALLVFNDADKQELKFQAALLDHCHVQANRKDGVAKRREEARQLLDFFNVPWSGRWGMVHTCPAGCCGDFWQGPAANKAKSIARAKDLVKFIFMPPISEPAANKYTKTDPCVRTVCLVTWTFGLLRKAIARMLRGDENYTGPADGNVDADGIIGIPRDTYQYEKNVGHLKVQKVLTFLSHASAKELLLVWVVVCTPIMRMHYFLFAHGKFFSHRSGDEDAITVFDFVGDTHFNHLSETMAALCSMLMEPDGLSGRWPETLTIASA